MITWGRFRISRFVARSRREGASAPVGKRWLSRESLAVAIHCQRRSSCDIGVHVYAIPGIEEGGWVGIEILGPDTSMHPTVKNRGVNKHAIAGQASQLQQHSLLVVLHCCQVRSRYSNRIFKPFSILRIKRARMIMDDAICLWFKRDSCSYHRNIYFDPGCTRPFVADRRRAALCVVCRSPAENSCPFSRPVTTTAVYRVARKIAPSPLR